MGGTGRNAGSWTIQAFQYVGIELIAGAAGRLLVIVVVTEGMAAPTQCFFWRFLLSAVASGIFAHSCCGRG